MSHGWAQAERTHQPRDNWRPFLRKKEEAKHGKYDLACKNSGWAFAAMPFGTWGGMGPEGARVWARISKMACAAVAVEERQEKSRELMEGLSMALMLQVWRLLAGSNYVQ